MNIDIQFHKPHLPPGEFITDLMQKRVRQGQPDEIPIILNGQPSTAYGWTDGIHSYQSIFVVFSTERIQEILIQE